MQETSKPGTWKLVALAYAGICAAFAMVRLVLISSARDPYLWDYELPRSQLFQTVCGIAAFILGLAGLFALGLVADRGTGKQLLVAMLALPLVLIMLEMVNMGF